MIPDGFQGGRPFPRAADPDAPRRGTGSFAPNRRRRFGIPSGRAGLRAVGLVLLLAVLGASPVPAAILVETNAVWAYRKGTAEASAPAEAWRAGDFDDDGWDRGAAPFYYDNSGTYTGRTRLDDMRNNYTTLYLRRAFGVSGLANLGRLRMRFFADDGFVVWLNGVSWTNWNKSGGSLAYNATASASATEPLTWMEFSFAAGDTPLREGDNLLAVQAFNASRTSSDFVFTLELEAEVRDTDPPRIAEVRPAPGPVDRLTEVTVVFSEPVTGVGFSDLQVNQRPATGVTGGGTTYTFSIEQPAPGPVRVDWDPGAAIEDLAMPPNRFDPLAPGSAWSYDRSDRTAPSLAEVTPAPGNTVRALSRIEVRFSEPVDGVDAGDLLVGGVPAASVTGGEAGPYVFQFEAATSGEQAVAWRADHGIRDRAEPANPFPGGSWTYHVDPAYQPTGIRISEFQAGDSGNTGLRDEDGEIQDWIELQNRGTAEVNLRGWSLSDDPEDPGKWVLPEVRLAPGGLLVVFASGKDRRPGGGAAPLHTNFKLGTDGEYLALFDAESPRRRVSGFDPAYPVQRNDVSYGYDPADRLRYFPSPTPGRTNTSSAVTAALGPVEFNVARGVFSRSFELHLSTADEGAEIRYTLDGSEPTATTGVVYRDPLPVTRTTVIRASAFRAGALPPESATHTYVFPADVARQSASPPGLPATWIDTQGRSWTADYGMDPEIVDSPAYRDRVVPALEGLPVLSLVTRPADMFDNTTGIYPKSQGRGPSWERPASVEFIDWERGTSVQARCGVQMQGNSVRDPVKTGKHAFRVVFKGDYGPSKLQYRVFPDSPLEEFDTLTLRADFNNSWMHWNGAQRPRGMRVRDAWMKESQRAMGGLSSHSRFFHLYVNGLYWGIYDATERPDASFAAAYQGGEKADYDVVNEGQLVDGTMTAYQQMLALGSLQTPAGYEQMRAYLDLPAYIDYLLLHFYTGHEDWFTDKNWYASRRRVPGAGFRYQSWDGELMLNSPTQNIVTRTDQPSGLHPKLLASAQYRLDFADRVQRHCFGDGALTPAAAAARFERWAAALEPAMVAESARWGDYRRDVHQYSSEPYELYTVDVHFRAERERLRTQYFPGRTATLLAQLKAAGLYPASAVAPSMSPAPGRLPPGSPVTLAVPSGEIFYTTDGSDPRTPHAGVVSPSARAATGPLTLEGTVHLKARSRLGAEWSALVEGVYEAGAPGFPLAITEVHYHPPDGDPYEFIEFRNHGSLPVDVSGCSLEGVSWIFPPGSVFPAGRIVVLASDLSPTSFASRHPGIEVFGWFDGSLSDGGERLALRDPGGRLLLSVDYDDGRGWPVEADGRGSSLELVDPRGDPDAPASWRASAEREGTPGFAATIVPGPSGVRLSEVLAGAGSGPGAPDWVEIHNAGPDPVDLGGWGLEDSGAAARWTFPPGTLLAAGGYRVVECVGAAGGVGSPAEGQAPLALAQGGDTVILSDAAGRRIDTVTWGLQIPGASIARTGESAAWNLAVPTPAAPNTPLAQAEPSSLRINEWLADAPVGGDDWIELVNLDPVRPAALPGWTLETAAAGHRLAALSFVAPGGHVVVRADERPGPDHVDFKLPASGGWIRLLDPAGLPRDRVDYGLQAEGVSQGRLPDGADLIESFPSSSSPGAPNYRPEYRGPVLHEVLAWNRVSLPDAPPGDVPPGWIELFNRGDAAFDLGGLGLASDEPGTAAWRFPAGIVVPSGGFVVVRCDGTRPAAPDDQGRFNTGWSLSRTGGTVRLLDPAGRRVDVVAFGAQVADRSLGRILGGWQLSERATPGAPNAGAAALGSVADLRVNEWLASPATGADWLELYHRGSLPVALTGLHLTDDPSLAGVGRWPFPPLSFLGPGGYLRLEADGRTESGPGHVGFRISDAGEALLLVDAGGRVVDAVYFGRQPPGWSQGRLPDGADGPLQVFASPTPGTGNAPVVIPAPVVESAAWDAGVFRLRIQGAVGPEYRLEGSLDLREWVPQQTARPASMPFEWAIPGEPAAPGWFFRVVALP